MSKEAICNRALQKVGSEARILILDTDDTRESRECLRVYDLARKAALRSHPWNFALERESLAALSTAPLWGYALQYQWPTNCLRVLRIIDDELNLAWKVEGRKILTDCTAPLKILYVKDEEDTAQFDAQFFEVLAHMIAIQIVEPLTQSNTKKQVLLEELRPLLAAATLTDALEGTPDDFAEDSWLQARA